MVVSARREGGRRQPREAGAPLNELAYRKIRAAIHDGTLGRRAPLSEDRLARTLGVSRTPVREALKRLAVEGLVEIFPRRGTFVSAPDMAQLREIFEIREALEGMAARLAAARVERSALDRFRARLDRAYRTGAADDLFAVGRALHEWIIAGCGNGRLAEHLAALRSQIRIVFSMGSRLTGQRERSYREYHALVQAMAAGDAAGAERAMRRHIASVRRNLLGS